MSKKEMNEEIVDAKDTGSEVAVRQETAPIVAPVSGVHLEFPFVRIGQGMSQWRTPEGRAPVPGCFYIGKNKDNNVLIADGPGKTGGFNGIVLEKIDGFKEERKWESGMGAPRRWTIAGFNADGTQVTEKDCLAAAAEEGFSLAPRPTGDVWPDTGRPIMKANLSRFCYLYMLVPLPEDFDSDDFRIYPIGDKLYTTARYEFDRQYYKQMDGVLANIRSRAMFANRKEKGYVWNINGMLAHIYSAEVMSRSGTRYISVGFERAVGNGRVLELTEDEKSDFARFLMSISADSTTIDEVGDASEF